MARLQIVEILFCWHNKSPFAVANWALNPLNSFCPNARAFGIEFQCNPSILVTPRIVKGEARSLYKIGSSDASLGLAKALSLRGLEPVTDTNDRFPISDKLLQLFT